MQGRQSRAFHALNWWHIVSCEHAKNPSRLAHLVGEEVMQTFLPEFFCLNMLSALGLYE